MKNKIHGLPVILAGLTAIGPFTIDTYLPAFEVMRLDLHATPEAIKHTLTVYMAAFAAMALWHGAISDRFGRRPVLIITCLLYALASLVCMLATTANGLWVGRILQGLCAGAGMVVGRAVIRDVYEGPSAQRLMAQVMMIFGVAPALAPLIGGVLLENLGWRSIFLFLFVVGVGLAGLCWRFLPETLSIEARRPFKPLALARAYRQVLSDHDFMLISGGMAIAFNGYFIYVLTASTFIRTHLGWASYDFAKFFVPAVACGMLGSWVSARLAGRWSVRRTIILGMIIMTVASVIEIAVVLLPVDRVWVLVPISAYNFGVAIISPSLSLAALELFPERKGLASSCQGFVQVAVNAITGLLAPYMDGSLLSLTLFAGGCFVTAVVFFAICARFVVKSAVKRTGSF